MRRAGVVLAIIGVSGFLTFCYYWDQRQAPVGNWYGTFVSPTGRQGAVQLVIKRANQCDDCGDFDGTGLVCIDRPISQSYEIDGRFRDFLKHRDAHVRFRSVGKLVTSRLTIRSFTWEGDRLRIAFDIEDFDGVNVITSSASLDGYSGPGTTVVLEKGTDSAYEAACNRLATGA